MTRGRFYGAAMPIWAIVYVIVLIATHHNATFAAVGALVFALIAIVGATLIRPGPDSSGRNRRRRRQR